MSQTISWNPAKLSALRSAYETAMTAGHKEFTFIETEGVGIFAKAVAEHPFVVAYAKHLIDYLEGEFAAHPMQPMQPNREGKEGE